MAVRILLVDDESLDRRLLKQILATYPDMDLVGEASSGDEAISAVARLHPDIVLMDIRMPTMDGITATREIKSTYPHVKVIGLSDYAQGCDADAMEKAGAVGVYPKSRAPENLYSTIKKSQVDPAI
jgi:two-component system, NarL family, response regulator LiaR